MATLTKTDFAEEIMVPYLLRMIPSIRDFGKSGLKFHKCFVSGPPARPNQISQHQIAHKWPPIVLYARALVFINQLLKNRQKIGWE